jgi:molybdate-binding protein
MVRMPHAQGYDDEITSDDPEAFQVGNGSRDAPLGLDEYIESLSSLVP